MAGYIIDAQKTSQNSAWQKLSQTPYEKKHATTIRKTSLITDKQVWNTMKWIGNNSIDHCQSLWPVLSANKLRSPIFNEPEQPQGPTFRRKSYHDMIKFPIQPTDDAAAMGLKRRPSNLGPMPNRTRQFVNVPDLLPNTVGSRRFRPNPLNAQKHKSIHEVYRCLVHGITRRPRNPLDRKPEDAANPNCPFFYNAVLQCMHFLIQNRQMRNEI